jgi:hypothetical protein
MRVIAFIALISGVLLAAARGPFAQAPGPDLAG